MTPEQKTELERRLCLARAVRSAHGAHFNLKPAVASDCKRWDEAESLLRTRTREQIVRILDGLRPEEADDLRERLNAIREWDAKQRKRQGDAA